MSESIKYEIRPVEEILEELKECRKGWMGDQYSWKHRKNMETRYWALRWVLNLVPLKGEQIPVIKTEKHIDRPEYPTSANLISSMKACGIEIDEDGIITVHPSDEKFHYFRYDDLIKIRRKT